VQYLIILPKARQIKRCMNAQDSCMSFEAIRKEASGDAAAGEEKPRLIVNPDFVENKDQSDGSTQWDPEVEEKVWNSL